jgi:hypothetical protein
MTTDTALIEKREELKRRLATGEYRTLVDVFLEWLDRLIRKITRQTKPLPIWLITVIICVVIIGIGNIAASGNLVDAMESYGVTAILAVNLLNILVIVITVVLNQSMHEIFSLWHDHILDATDSLVCLEDIENWLKMTCNWRLHLLVTILGGIVNGLYLITIEPLQGVYTSYGWIYSIIITAFIVSAFISVFLYLIMMLILLSVRLHRYNLRLFVADPSNSELVSRLSSKLSLSLYFVAGYGAINNLLTALSGGYGWSIGISQVLFYWLPIVIMFILNQTSLSSIIRRAKRKTLNEIQVKVEKLQSAENFEEKETMETINRLLDYHDRVKATRNSAIDLGTTLNFINSLLLPLLAFVLGNLDLVLNLFARKP